MYWSLRHAHPTLTRFGQGSAARIKGIERISVTCRRRVILALSVCPAECSQVNLGQPLVVDLQLARRPHNLNREWIRSDVRLHDGSQGKDGCALAALSQQRLASPFSSTLAKVSENCCAASILQGCECILVAP